ncbi:E3 ubiquitin-protein ligase MARCH8-like isoform X2 [Populus alba x Populus x berolinensis]|nr:E3 ubiquitin-protein ligase MARCH8-like isoform X2 [Populus alba x Populus x berolinensis]KAJ6892828.1 E3 ubiquitin-protein ligase MARCH8-like isoform X2 [Populus alba x Populus x berolinensis]
MFAKYEFDPDPILFAMQLVSNDSCKEDISESEPILSHSNISQHSEEEAASSLEIKSLGGDCEIHVDDLESIQIDETCHLVNPDQPQCRICLDNEGEDLIAPCHCKGTQKYVHRSCLDNWRSTKEGFAFAHCTECRAMFVLRANVPADRWWLRLKFQFLVARDHAFIFVVVQLEYVVEDREASKDVPELGASHVSELRMLGLY